MMVFYHTPVNIKILRNILLDFEGSNEMTPYEYMKTYIEMCPENIDETLLSWISDTFLGIEKHYKFLNEIASNMAEDISEEDLYYGIIILHAITFQISPEEMDFLYKSLFNVSKSLLVIFTKFLSNNEVLTYISHVAQASYDKDFITDKIIGPLFSWQPYISEMAHNYAEYVKKIESRKIKPLTVPVQPNVLKRRSNLKEAAPPTAALMPDTPPNSPHSKVHGKKMLTKSAIDKKLKAIHDKNKEKAYSLLTDINSKTFRYAQTEKSDKYYKTISNIKDEYENEYEKRVPKPRKLSMRNKLPPIKETAATLHRLNKKIKEIEEQEMEHLQNMMNATDPFKIEQIALEERQEKERERLLELEKRHVLGQLSHEEAIIAKKKIYEENKKKYEEFMKEKEQWQKEIEKWKKGKISEMKKYYESRSMNELNLASAKISVVEKKKEYAAKLKRENQMIIAEALRVKQEELERRINMIKEIKILAMIAKKARVPKVIDLTESAGLGFLCEMSLAELQERLSAMKIEIKEELDRKKALVRQRNVVARQEMEILKDSIQNYFADRSITRKSRRTTAVEVPTTQEITDLRTALEEKRKLRLKPLGNSQAF